MNTFRTVDFQRFGSTVTTRAPIVDHKSKIINYLFSFLMLFSCTKENKQGERSYPRIVTGMVTNINADGATFNGSFLQAGKSEIIDHGFVYDLYTNQGIQYGEKISLGSSNGSGSFTATVNFGLEKGKTYYVSAYAQNKNSIYYAEPVKFVSMGSVSPQILQISPTQGIVDDLVTIKGKYFSSSALRNTVAFNDKTVSTVSASDTVIVVQAPSSGGKEFADIFVTVSGQTAQKVNAFRYMKPEIFGISPKQGVIGDTVTLTGNYFHPYSTVRFNSVRAQIHQIDHTSAKVIVPACQSSSANISINVDGFTSFSEHSFTYAKADVIGLSPNIGVVGDTIVVMGKNFGYSKNDVSVFLGEQAVKIVEMNNSAIKIIVPASGGKTSLPVTVKVDGQLAVGYQMFSYMSPVIESFEPTSGKAGAIITVKGKNFSKIKKENLVMVDQMKFRILEANSNQLKVIIPDTTYSATSSISIKIDEKATFSTTNFELISPWTRKKDYSGNVIHRAFGFTVSGNAYFAGGGTEWYGGSLNGNYQYLPDTDQWIPKNEAWEIGWLSDEYTGFEGNGKYYFVSPFRNMIEYNPITDIWTEKRQSYTQSHNDIMAFSINNKGYTIRYNRSYINQTETWVYDQNNDLWELINVMDEFLMFEYCFTLNNKAYVGIGRRIFEFTPGTNEWKEKALLPANMQMPQYGYNVFSMLNKGYFIDFYYHPYNAIWEYDPLNNQCKIVSHFPDEVGNRSFFFVVNNKAYIAYNLYDGILNHYTKKFWEFDPSKL